MVKLRLRRMGKKFNPIYRIVAADARVPRDGKFIEEVGFYNPQTKELVVDVELRDKWLNDGAVPSETVKNLFSKHTILNKGKSGKIILPSKAKKAKKEAKVVE